MTSWMECGCGEGVTLYENPDAEYYGKKWPMIFTGICKACGMRHIEPPASLKKEWDEAREEFELELARLEEEHMKEQDGRYYGAVGAIKLCADEDRERCIGKLMAQAWHTQPQGFWLTRYGRPEIEWTWREAEADHWFDFHLHVTRWRPINGGDDSERYEEEFCCQNLDQVRRLLLNGGRIAKWELWKRGQDHKSLAYSGQLPKGGIDQLLEVFA